MLVLVLGTFKKLSYHLVLVLGPRSCNRMRQVFIHKL